MASRSAISRVEVSGSQATISVLKKMRIRNARKGGPNSSIVGFRSSEEVASDPDVAELWTSLFAPAERA